MTHWIATNTTVIVSKIIKRVVSYIILTLDAQNIRLQRVLRSRMSTNNVFVFVLEADISSIWYKDDVTCYTFDNFRNNNWQSFLKLFNDSLKCTCKYCVDGSICHFKFPKVVLAHILSEVGTFCIVLLNISSRTCIPFFHWNRFIFDQHTAKK